MGRRKKGSGLPLTIRLVNGRPDPFTFQYGVAVIIVYSYFAI
jgi:hypothetical protein